ncbi:MAG: hypothetical protein EA376_04335 [Phycisphaeraceae bacterium]|nr:MAG: hypothetical protein EA376_04335 [Phycisphaeraceae bacterium]
MSTQRHMKTTGLAALVCASAVVASPLPSPERIVNPEPIILAGEPLEVTTDRSAGRIDVLTPDSPFAGAVSLFVGGKHLATGTVISPRHILTAAHCFDEIGQGVNTVGTDVAIFLNVDGELSHVVPPAGVERVDLHPDFTGFQNPVVNDDLAIITLASPLPVDVPIYRIYDGPIETGLVVWMVGYGETGDGFTGYERGTGSFTVRRIGANVADAFYSDRHGRGEPHVWQFDFDGPEGDGFLGGPTLGPGVEATLGGGDSGGPGFVFVSGEPMLFSVNNYVSGPGEPGRFGSGGGGLIVPAQRWWIERVMGLRRIGDITGDGRVGAADMSALLSMWGDTDARGDLNGDGVVDSRDLAVLLQNWSGQGR